MGAEDRYYISDENDIYLYFEIINMLRPNSVVDVGMFLRRIGLISRQAKGVAIDESIVIDAINLPDAKYPNIYKVIYNNITDKLDNDKQYDLAILLKVKEIQEDSEYEEVIVWCLAHSKVLLIDYMLDWDLYGINIDKVSNVQLEDKSYYLIQG